MVLSPNDGCVLILPMKHFAGLGVLAIGLMGCGGDAPAPSAPAAETNTVEQPTAVGKTNTTPGNANISIKPTTEIPAATPAVKPKPEPPQAVAPTETPGATNNATSSGAATLTTTTGNGPAKPNKVQGEGNLTKKNGAFFSGDSPFNGQFVDHHDNGVKSVEGRFENGIQQGAWTFYHENGGKFRSGQYVDGRADGQWVIWREDGSKWSEQSYVNGQLNGLETRWHPNGQKESETTWEGGRTIAKKEWDESGAPKQ